MVAKACEVCGKVYSVSPSKEAKSAFCSRPCQQEGYRLRQPRVLVSITCQTCETTFEVDPSRLKHGRGKSCSPECQYAAARSRPKMEVELTCAGCGDRFMRPRSAVAAGNIPYCTRECRNKHRIGALHPQYLGREPYHRGPNWQAQRRKARNRDKRTCQRCGEHGIDVHHIRPFRLFADYREANALANLVTLCKPCHRRADAEMQAQGQAAH